MVAGPSGKRWIMACSACHPISVLSMPIAGRVVWRICSAAMGWPSCDKLFVGVFEGASLSKGLCSSGIYHRSISSFLGLSCECIVLAKGWSGGSWAGRVGLFCSTKWTIKMDDIDDVGARSLRQPKSTPPTQLNE